MHPAAAKPIRFIVELPVSELPAVLTQVLSQVTAHLSTPGAPPRPDPDDDEDDDEPLMRTADPPPGRGQGQAAPAQNSTLAVAHMPPMPVLPPHVGRTRYLGKPCVHGHTYAGSEYGLRKKSNGGCIVCSQIRERARKKPAVRPLAPVTPRAPALPHHEMRPELPAHLALTTFLSPITCVEGSHRYRDMPEWTLRDLADERCTMCVMQQSQLALAGD